MFTKDGIVPPQIMQESVMGKGKHASTWMPSPHSSNPTWSYTNSICHPLAIELSIMRVDARSAATKT